MALFPLPLGNSFLRIFEILQIQILLNLVLLIQFRKSKLNCWPWKVVFFEKKRQSCKSAILTLIAGEWLSCSRTISKTSFLKHFLKN